MEYADWDFLGPRFLFGYVALFAGYVWMLWMIKDKIDDLSTKAKRRKAWSEYWRKNWEVYLVGSIITGFLIFVTEPGIVAWDHWRGTDYFSAYIKGSDIAISVVTGLFWLPLFKMVFRKGKKAIDSL